jgi:hypothetical protein
MSTLLKYTLYLETCPATENFKGALPSLEDIKNKVGRPHEERHMKCMKRVEIRSTLLQNREEWKKLHHMMFYPGQW